jgi:hypothetical protein
MTYNQTKVNGVAMPLLMGCTEPTKLETFKKDVAPIYNPESQTVIWKTMAANYTMSKRNTRTYKPGNSLVSDIKTIKDD